MVLRKKEKEVDTLTSLGGNLKMDMLVLHDKIGQGTYGKVYRGFCLGNEVAIKVIKEGPDQDHLREFKIEADVLK